MLDFRLEGIDELLARIGFAASAINDPDTRKAAAIRALEPVRDHAKDLVSVRSGALREGIVIVPADEIDGGLSAGYHDGFTSDGTVFVGPVSDELFYAWFVEFGTVNMAAQPFMRPAWEAQSARVLELLGEELASRVELALGTSGRGFAPGYLRTAGMREG